MTNYDTIYLDVPPDVAARAIADRVAHLRRSRDGEGFEYRTNAGAHLATLSPRQLSTGDAGSRLRFRTSVLAPHLFHARHKAKEIRDAVGEFRVPDAEA